MKSKVQQENYKDKTLNSPLSDQLTVSRVFAAEARGMM